MAQSQISIDRVLDLFIVFASALVVHLLYFGDLEVIPVRMIVLLFSGGCTYAFFAIGGLYTGKDGLRLSETLGRLTICFALVVLTTGLFAFLSKIAIDVSRFWFGSYMVLAHFGLCSYRILHRYYLVHKRKKGWNRKSILIAGSGPLCALTLKRLHEQMWVGINVVGIFDSSNRDVNREIELVGSLDDIPSYIENCRKEGNPISQVWITLPPKEEEAIEELGMALKDSSTDICIVPNAFGIQLLNGTQFNIADLSVVNVSEIKLAPFGEWFKIGFDYISALIAVLLLMPVMFVIAIIIKVDSPGKVLFKQRRYGVDGKEIEVWKFRTMSVVQDGEDVRQATQNDARVTKVGKFLRRTSLDELPQFFNVLQGRMSVVGPRPHAVIHNEEYRKKIDGYMMRHKIKPGITGWAQVNGLRGETDTLDKMEKRVQYDLEYIKNWSAWLDLKIVLLTIVRGFNSKNVY